MKVYLHIGMPRTGTTFLQQEIFPMIEDINFINFRYHGGILFKMVSINKFNNIFSNIENVEYETVEKNVLPYLRNDKINLLSDENIYDNMWLGEDRRWRRINRLKELFPSAKIIFGIREKDSLLRSLYKKYVMDGGILSFDEFIQTINLDKLEYEKYIQHLFRLFGKRNVYIYRYEKMKNDIHSFVEELCNFMKVEVPSFKNIRRNAGYSQDQIKISLIINRLFRTYHNPQGIFPIQHKWLPHRIAFVVINELIR